ncbi:MAG TPA: DUF1549 and DUF1553 domain-containing protein [Pirellulales bacterium]|nr:DUF1549 and DUF1553 domain-containing protein [Pirellulales bacterium]
MSKAGRVEGRNRQATASMGASMGASASWVAGALISALVWALATAGAASASNAAETAKTKAARDLSPLELAARIDAVLAAAWQAEGVAPAPPADDAEFLRRASLDIIGKIPAASEVRAFLGDRSPDKRSRLVESLLARGGYANHFANLWRELLLPGANTSAETRALAPPLEAWLRLRFAEDTPYDRLVLELLTPAAMAPAALGVAQPASAAPSPLAFFQVNEYKPENLAANASRIFLGTQVQCAQCHDHPFARWKRQEFWALAAFFSGSSVVAQAQPPVDPNDADAETLQPVGLVASAEGKLAIQIPDTDLIAEARFLDGTAPEFRAGEDSRLPLARWLTSRDNPYFARALVNRLWEHFLGRGFVDPVDDLDEANPASHAELFDEIAAQFAYRQYDIKYLVRAITATRAYQLSSQSGGAGQDDSRLFARMPLRRMSPEQLYDSLVQATGFRDATSQAQANVLQIDDTAQARLKSLFADQTSRRSESQTSILQALSLMNGALVSDATSLERSELLSAVAEMPFLDSAARVETLYLAALGRFPGEAEQKLMLDFLAERGAKVGEKRALADIFWALLNSAEFILNH